MRTTVQTCILVAPAFVIIFLCLVSTEKLFKDQHLKERFQNLQVFAKYRPKHSASSRKNPSTNVETEVRRTPVGVMKMSLDEGEKFFPHYWLYEAKYSGDGSRHLNPRSEDNKDNTISNASMAPALRVLIGSNNDGPEKLAYGVNRNLESRSSISMMKTLQKRDFKCPTETNDCSAIGYPNSCCPSSDTCFAIKDTGLGPVGCCRKGSNCGGTIHGCSAPNTGCSSDTGGGCCVKNYICAVIGCTINPTMIVSTIVTVTATFSSSSEISTYTSISTLPIFSETTSTRSCHEDSTDSGCISNTGESDKVTATGDLPVRPTSLTSSPSSVSSIDLMCPTGFYGCNAFHEAGCCRTGRNCDKTSCLPTASTSLVTDGVTIIVPVGTGASTANPSSTCAVGWSLCSANEGKGCCPSGWKCGSNQCYDIRATATATISQELPNSAKKTGFSAVNVICCALLINMILNFS